MTDAIATETVNISEGFINTTSLPNLPKSLTASHINKIYKAPVADIRKVFNIRVEKNTTEVDKLLDKVQANGYTTHLVINLNKTLVFPKGSI